MSQFEAVRLFVDRAVAVKPDFAVTNETAPAVAEICHRLDGLPLAIELAAARIRMLPPQTMLARLGQRLPLLTGGARDAPARQQTLRNAIAWSYDLLEQDEQKLYRRLSVFAGGWTLEAAEAVAGSPASGELDIDVLAGLEYLVEHSLVRQEADAGGSPRFTMLETVREYGLEQLTNDGEAHEARERHASHFLALAEAADDDLYWGRAEAAWMRWLAVEGDNLRAALEWGVEHDPAIAARLVRRLMWLWQERGAYREWEQWHSRTAQRAAELDAPLRAVLALSGARAANRVGAWELTQQRLDTCLPVFKAIGDEVHLAIAMNTLANLTFSRADGDRGQAYLLLKDVLQFHRDHKNRHMEARILGNLSIYSDYLGFADDARAYNEQAVAIHRTMESPLGLATALNNLGVLEYVRDNYERASACLAECLHIAREHDLDIKVEAVEGLGHCAIGLGNVYRGVVLLIASQTARGISGLIVYVAEDAELQQQALATARETLGDEAYEQAAREGAALSIDDAVSLALGDSQPPSSIGE
jgi:tetratricopeptide (TPR) repeat protein